MLFPPCPFKIRSQPAPFPCFLAELKQKKSAAKTTPATPPAFVPKSKSTPKKVATTPPKTAAPQATVSQLRADLEGMNLYPTVSGSKGKSTGIELTEEEMSSQANAQPFVSQTKEKIIEEARKKELEEKPVLSLVVVGEWSRFFNSATVLSLTGIGTGHVDAGKSTLMGRMLHELGELSDRTLEANQRQSQKIGKGSFAYAWAFDAMDEERARCVCGASSLALST